MPFPEVPRVIFKENPLEEVVFQVRFPPILKIDAEVPAAFQDRIRDQFPEYKETMEVHTLANLQRANLLAEPVQPIRTKNHRFISEDGHWTVSLTRTFIALTTDKYERWEEFKEKLEVPINALDEIYAPSHYARIGLRYINVLKRSKLGLEGKKWKELVHPSLLGVLSAEGLEEEINISVENKTEITLPDQHGLIRLLSQSVKDVKSEEECFMIDSDFHKTGKTQKEDIWEILDFFNKRSSWLIQWSITPVLREAMKPQQV